MSEYTEAFNVSRLIGAPPGYVGYEEGGQLTERVRRHPYSIVLLDEIEKAHGNVFNLLLQVLDEGRLTDGNGRFVDFRNTVIIMTSNAGTRQLKDFGRGVGFTSAGSGALMLNEQDKEHARQIVQKALSKQFSPEFLNRLDEIITFDQLDLEAIKQIIDVELEGLYKRISDMGYTIDLSEEAKKFVAEKGYDVQFGARPLKRAIQNHIEDLVCERIIDGELAEGSVISVEKNPEKEELQLK
jgi:ATP-dependent Clp protease ATP-binding subunit ClpC